MEWMDSFCELYCKYIEGDNPEYFRFPEYKGNANFAGNRLDIRWLCYNLSLIILKLLHFSGLIYSIKGLRLLIGKTNN